MYRWRRVEIFRELEGRIFKIERCFYGVRVLGFLKEVGLFKIVWNWFEDR